MAPTPQETMVEGTPNPEMKPLTGEEVVISGISGIFPNSDDVKTFMENLYNKVDMVDKENTRWVFNHPEVPNRLGTINGMGKFDAQFFRVHFKQACTMEPMSRKLLEHSYGAIYDSGNNPEHLRGTKVGVFIGSTFSESEKVVIYETIQHNGFGITGCNKAMYANRISYWIDGKGPSYALDLACASSMACLEHAYRAISDGQCDAAIVGGCNLCKHPCISLNLKRAGFLCLDGVTKCFDKRGDGYARSDSINVLFLQRAKDAKRIYSQVYHAKGSYGLQANEEFLPLRESQDIKDFLEAFYSGINLSPTNVEFVEAHASGIAEADGNELEAIGHVFAKEKPIKVGSVKSNMGHSEPASGVCAVTKVCLAYHTGKLPANLHYEQPQDHISAVRDGKVHILQEHEPFNRGFVALNSFSYSGANIHVLLKGHYKHKDLNRYKSEIPRLVLVSGRQESCVKEVINELTSSKIDPEQIGLLHRIHELDIPGHMCRGYCIIEPQQSEEHPTATLAQKSNYFDGITRPVWFVYSGMGSQWAGMGAELMKIPIFSAAIEKCRRVLEPKGIDIVHILTSPDKAIYDNILHSFVGIAAVQIGLTDILREMGIVPDNIIGHSVGELGCAYADGCFTAEEMILSAYSRGLVSVQTPFIKGSMAAIGLGYKTVLPMCPPEIEVACHNSSESATISGPAEIMKDFVGKLTEKGIFAREVPCSNIAYHSRYISGAGPGLRKYLSEVITNPKPRSEKWVSTSVPQEMWDTPAAKYSSAEYHTNNLLNSVLFEETSNLIPSNAIVIEIAPHGLLQAILKRSLATECIHVPLTRRANPQPVKFFLEAIGKLYESGLNPKVSAIYPKIEFPVSTGTPLLSHLVKWEHSENWPQGSFINKDAVVTQVRKEVVSIQDDDYKHLEGYVRNGIIVFPEAALLFLVWETFAMKRDKSYRDLSVTFTDVKFHEVAALNKEEALSLSIMVHKGNSDFEVSYQKRSRGNEISDKRWLLVSGIIKEKESKIPRKESTESTAEENFGDEDYNLTLNCKDIYKIMFNKGYLYKNVYQSIYSSSYNRKIAEIKWTDDWIIFIDSIIQLNAFAKDHNGVSIPKIIKYLQIDVEEHGKEENKIMENNVLCYRAVIDHVYDSTKCGGVEFKGLVLKNIPVTEDKLDVLKTRTFVPHLLMENVPIETALNISLQIVEENALEFDVKVTNLVEKTLLNISNALEVISDNTATSKIKVKSVETANLNLDVLLEQDPSIKQSDLVIIKDFLSDDKKLLNVHEILANNSFVLSVESKNIKLQTKYKYFDIITAMLSQNKILVLLKKSLDVQMDNISYIPVTHDVKFSWIPRVQNELQKTRKVVLVSEKQPYCGLLGLVKILRKYYKNKISLLIIDDLRAPSFDPNTKIFNDQIQKKLAFNVLKKGQWGGYYDLPSSIKIEIQNVTLTSTVPGKLDSLTWVESPSMPPSKNIVQVCYAGPSYRDAMKAVGKINDENISYGMDFSGIDSNGKRVMGVVASGSVSSTIQTEPELLWPVPDHWSLEDAATVPMPYVHAYYLLLVKCQLRNGSTVFIHGGAGALGQAVISLCLSAKCNIFTTVSDLRKKRFLMKLFPELNENNIGNSRDSSFQTMVIENTKNKCCDVVISCASGYLRKATMKCAGLGSIFLDLNEQDMMENSDFGMMFLIGEKNYKGISLGNIFKPCNLDERQTIQLAISEGIARGTIRPLTRVVYPPTEVAKAFRLLSSRKHRGRTIIKLRDPEATDQSLNILPRVSYYLSKGSFLVVCDGNSFGLEVADRLIKRGARTLMIHIQKDWIDGYFYTKMASWRKQGVAVKVSSENLQTEKGCANLLRDVTKMGDIEGIFVAHVSSKGKSLQLVTQDDFLSQFNDKALIVANLDLVSRNVCNNLSHFVVITQSSSEASTAYMNSMAEKICQERISVGFPALYFQIGLLDEFEKDNAHAGGKMRPQSLNAVFTALEASLKMKYHNVSSYNLKKEKTEDFIEKIKRIVGIKNINELPDSLMIRDLCVSDVIIEEIKSLIRHETKEFYPVEKIENLSIYDLKQINGNYIQNTKFDSGLDAFFTFIDKDECLATEPMIAMPTKISTAMESEEELNPKATYLMLIPGFEGHHQMFTSICERLKVQAMVFQLGPDITADSIPEMAAGIMKFMKKRFELKSKFYLLGYSFGVNVALELAALMEKEGHVGIVFCLDSSPDALKIQLGAYLGSSTENELQNSIVEHMYQLMTGERSEKLAEDLKRSEQWHQKVEAGVNRLRGLVNHSNQYKRTLLEAAYKRIILARNYETKLELESEIVLLKGIPHPNSVALADDYNLSKYSKQPVKVFNLYSDHAVAPQDCRVSNIINRHLEPNVLEEFKKMNLCEVYRADPFKIF